MNIFYISKKSPKKVDERCEFHNIAKQISLIYITFKQFSEKKGAPERISPYLRTLHFLFLFTLYEERFYTGIRV